MHQGNNTTEQESFSIKTYKAEVNLLLITVTWGLSFPLIKLSLQYVSPVFYNFLRFLITLIAFYLLFRKKFDIKNFAAWKYGMILGIYLFFGFALQAAGLKYTSASKSAFITGTSLVFIPFAQYLIMKTKPKPENIIGGIIVMTGLYILSEAYLTIPNVGDIITFVCAIMFAIHVVLLSKYSGKTDFYYLVFGQFLTVTVLSLLFTLVADSFQVDQFYFVLNTRLVLLLIYTSFISTFFSILLMTKYQKLTTPLRAGIIYNMESLFAVFFAFILLGEILNFHQIAGALIMIFGLFISEFYGLIKFKFSNADKSKDHS